LRAMPVIAARLPCDLCFGQAYETPVCMSFE
jgi:hypothetical protein